MTTFDQHLAAGDTPLLLAKDKCSISRGPFHYERRERRFNQGGSGYYTYCVYGLDGKLIAEFQSEKDQEFFASLMGDPNIVEELWEDYCLLKTVMQDYLEAQNFESAAEVSIIRTRKLRRLDGLKCIGWREKV